jgi:Cdc6-like AAA superfamily ATPase
MYLLPRVATLYHRLILIVAPSGTGKTAALHEVAKHTGDPYINVNLELSRCMLGLTQRQRQLQVSRLLLRHHADIS